MSGIEAVYPTDDNRPVIVGERTNVIGSRQFKELIVEEKFEEAAEIGRAQVQGRRAGARRLPRQPRPRRGGRHGPLPRLRHPQGQGPADDRLDRRRGASSWRSRHCQGKAIVNSINLEDGEERFEQVVPLLRDATARAVVVGCIDEDKSRAWRSPAQRKLAIAERSHDAAHREVRRCPSATSSSTRSSSRGHRRRELHRLRGRDHRGHARDQGALPARARPSSASPTCPSACPPAGREVLNAVFLYHCTKAGLDYAIVNTERLERYASIPEEERAARRGPDLLARRGSGGRLRRPLPRAHAGPRRTPASRCRSTSGSPATSSRARKDGLLDDLGAEARGAGRARHHQRAADGGHGRGRAPLQRQPAHRGRGAAVRRGDEGGGGLPRAVHGEGRERRARHDRARHREGRRPRHRQEPGRDHPQQQRLPDRQPRASRCRPRS